MAGTLRTSCVALPVALLSLGGGLSAALGQSTSDTALQAERTGTTTSAQTDTHPLEPKEDPWRIELYAWAWLMGTYGKLGVGDHTTRVSASFLDIGDSSDSLVAFSGRVELGYGKLGFYADGLYADIGVEDIVAADGSDRADVSFQETTVDFGVMYRIGEWEPTPGADRNPRNVTLDLYAGARYMNLQLELDPVEASYRLSDREWFDPIVGAKFVVPFAEHWHLAINGDIGGFGVSSDFTWSSTLVVGYDFHIGDLPASLMFGYRAIGWQYSDGSGDDEFRWDITQHGAILGFALTF